MWKFLLIWAVYIAISVPIIRGLADDFWPRATISLVVICAPYWVLERSVLKKLSWGEVFWRSVGVYFLGILLGGGLFGIVTEAGWRWGDDDGCTYHGRFGDC
jgi:hypothetical protein